MSKVIVRRKYTQSKVLNKKKLKVKIECLNGNRWYKQEAKVRTVVVVTGNWLDLKSRWNTIVLLCEVGCQLIYHIISTGGVVSTDLHLHFRALVLVPRGTT